MSIQRPWTQTPAGESCGRCVAALAGGVGGLGSYDHVHQVTKVPRRRIANRQWVRCMGWAVECVRIPGWLFFVELEAAVVFARAAMQTDDLGTVDVRHAYTEAVFSPGGLGPTRRFLGLAGTASRSLFNDRLLQSWVDKQVPDRGALENRAS